MENEGRGAITGREHVVQGVARMKWQGSAKRGMRKRCGERGTEDKRWEVKVNVKGLTRAEARPPTRQLNGQKRVTANRGKCGERGTEERIGSGVNMEGRVRERVVEDVGTDEGRSAKE